jgi:ring-1,2-phenylacetyl-CoA epoxidase subunit PaaC
MTLSPAAREYVLALADDEHAVGARHANWIGLGPFLEEDLAFCSIAQDELGHAVALYSLLLADPAELDRFAMMRDGTEYRSCWLAELDCPDWSDSLVRHWLYDRGEALRWEALAECSDERVRAVAARAQREEAFHLAHAEQFLSRAAAADATRRIAESVARLLPLAAGLWDPTPHEADAIGEGFVTVSSRELGDAWEHLVRGDLDRWGVRADWPASPVVAAQLAAQQNRSARSATFAEFQADLLRVVLLDPAAVW